MNLLPFSFFAGVLTILAPCVLPLLPVIIGGSVTENEKNNRRAYIITAALSVSIILFTLLLKFSTAFITIPPIFWKIFSGSIVLFFGITLLFPNLWKSIGAKCGLNNSNTLLQKSSQKKGIWGEILMGASLGPVFASCSPTYFLIVGTVLPQSFSVGLLNLVAYALGLSSVMLLIAIFGGKIIKKLKGAANPNGWFKKVLGTLFIIVGLAVMTGLDKKLEGVILQSAGSSQLLEFEQNLIKDFE